jgi:uncharacterized membrane protein
MWKRKDIKGAGRSAFRRNFFICFIACIIWVFIASGPFSISSTIETDSQTLQSVAKEFPDTPFSTAVDAVIQTSHSIQQATSLGEDSSRGAIHDLYSTALESRGYVDSLVKILGETLESSDNLKIFISIIGVILLAALYYFLDGTLEVGLNRLFLESRTYPSTGLTRLLFIFRVRRTWQLMKVVYLKLIYLALWSLTIAGFFIKYYSYYLIPFIMAENPDTPRKEVFALSKRMMKGNKWRVFVFDLSFWYWYLLSIVTFGVLDYFIVNPYRRAAKAELYATLRAEAKAENLPGVEFLNDELLFTAYDGEPIENCKPERYPLPLYHIAVPQGRHWIDVVPKTHYTVLHLALMFFIFAMTGWIWEGFVALVEHGTFVNRGVLYGPWLPIYGVGGVILIVSLNRFARRPALVFVASIVISGVLEYATATILWETMHLQYWNYSGFFFNIQGRICLEGLLTFAIAGMAGIYFFAPLLDNLLEKIPRKTKVGVVAVLATCFCVDVAYSTFHPHTGANITDDE